MQDFSFNKFPASAIAAAALHLTLQMMRPRNQQLWTPTIMFYTQWKEVDILPLVLRIREIHWQVDASQFKAPTRKYEKAEMSSVAHYAALRYQDLRFDDTTNIKLAKDEIVGNLTSSNELIFI